VGRKFVSKTIRTRLVPFWDK